MYPLLKSKLLVIVLVIALLVALIFLGLIALRFAKAERLNDLVDVYLVVMYDCNGFPRQKYDQRYWKNEELEGCGVPDVKLEFMNDKRERLLEAVTSRQGKYHLYDNSAVDTSLAKLKFLQITSERCKDQLYEFSLSRTHSFYGESASSRQYRYSGNFKFFCTPVEAFQ